MEAWLQAFQAQVMDKAARARQGGFTPPSGPTMDALPDVWRPRDVALKTELGRTKDGEHWRPERELVRAVRHPRWAACPVCDGSGYLHGVTHRQGKTEGEILEYSGVKPCKCGELDHRIELYNRASLPGHEAGKTWGQINWGTDPYMATDWGRRPGEESATLKDVMTAWIRTWTRGAEGLLFQGDTGTGKTHLAHALVQSLILTHGASAIWWSSRELTREMSAAHMARVPFHGIIQQMIGVDVLVFDELRDPEEWWWKHVVDALEIRAESRRTTIITTNLYTDHDGGNLKPTLGSRLASRLLNVVRVFEIDGDDQRRNNRP